MKSNYPYFFPYLRANDLPIPVPEFQFHPKRKWKFDYAWEDYKIALEVEGGIFSGGRHTRPKGFIGDMEKYNSAAVLGWRIIRVQPKELETKKTIDLLREILIS